MVDKIKKVLKKRHFWRTIGFDELSEIYTSQMLRSLGISIIGIFVPIYLYKIGYDLQSIFAMFLIWIAIRPLFTFISAKTIAHYGPKHTIAIATIIHILYLAVLLTIQDQNWPIYLISIFGSLSAALFNNAFEVDFSKVKHTEHGGKELGYVQIFERTGAVIGPLVGGLLATFADPKITILAAIIIFSASLIPIFLTKEPIHTKQKLIITGFPFKRHERDFISSSFLAVENTVSLVMWPLFISITIFTTQTFAALGLLSSISTAVALLTVYMIGKTIDKRKGGKLLKFGATFNALLHLVRPFATNPLQAVAINLTNEPLTSSYRMPYIKGRYDAADSAAGYRIVYFAINDIFLFIGNLIFWIIIWLACFYIDPITVLQLSFILGSIASLGIMLQKFEALKDIK